MRKLVVAMALSATAAALVACGGHGSKKLEGHWKGVRVEGVSPDVQATANQFALRTEIRVHENQIAILTPAQPQGQQATYTVVGEDKDKVVVHTDKDNQNETFGLTEDGKTLTWRMDEVRTMIFQRLPDKVAK